ncbi:MAG: helix-turn-helix domain-containing protein, partial [Bacteroidaceae bacterium]|nr:helix-turn-helix domain-containing protein [Bacteroidaceae bacterium]
MDANKSIEQRIEELESLVYASKNVLSFDEASKFLSLSKSYLYKLTSAGLIPHYKPQGKMIYFEILLSGKTQNSIKSHPEALS